MDTLLQDLRSALQALGEHPAVMLAAAMSLALRLETRAAPDTTRHRVRPVAPPPHVVASPRRTASWMDYIDFRRGSGDVLRWIDSSMLTDEGRTCGE